MKAGQRSFSSFTVSPIFFFSILFLFSIFTSDFWHPRSFFVQKTLNTTGFSVLALVTSWESSDLGLPRELGSLKY